MGDCSRCPYEPGDILCMDGQCCPDSYEDDDEYDERSLMP